MSSPISKLRSRLANWAGITSLKNFKAETTRLATEVDTFRHAFETTVEDRDAWKDRAHQLEVAGGTDILLPIDLQLQHQLACQLNLVQRADHYFFIDVVGSCNLSCPSCAVGNSISPFAKGVMSVDKFEAIVSKIKSEYGSLGRIFIDLYNWGEPGLHPKLSKLVRIAKAQGFGVGISSNLNVFPDLRETIKAAPDYLRISFSGMRAKSYSQTHRDGSVYALISNMYRIRELLDRYNSPTIVQAGYHIYRTNFPGDFLAARSLCDELGFLFSPIVASVMPAEKVVAMNSGREREIDSDLLEKLVLPVAKIFEIFRSSGPPTGDCQFRQARTTINYDGSVNLCCATYDKDKIIETDFLSTSNEQIKAAKYSHSFCNTCMQQHVNKLYTGIDNSKLNAEASKVLGSIFQSYLDESELVGNQDYIFLDNSFINKNEIYDRGMSSLSLGEPGWPEAERCFEALVTGVPEFAEGFFQAAALANAQGKEQKSLAYAEEAARMVPEHNGYRDLLIQLQDN